MKTLRSRPKMRRSLDSLRSLGMTTLLVIRKCKQQFIFLFLDIFTMEYIIIMYIE